MVPAVDITPLDFLTRASFVPVALVLIGTTSAAYGRCVHRLGRGSAPWPPGRTAAFVAAEVTLLVGLVSGLASFVSTSFTAGAVQHVLVGMLAPALFVSSAPVTLARRGAGPRLAGAVERVAESTPVRLLSRPAVAWPVYGAWFYVLYLSPLYADTIDHAALRALVNLVSLGTGLLFFWPAVSADRFAQPPAYWLRMLYLILLLPCHTILGMALESQSTRIARGISVTDLHTGAGVLWAAGEAIGLLGTIAVFVAWLRSDERAARQADELQEASATAALAHWRATRDAATRAASRAAPR